MIPRPLFYRIFLLLCFCLAVLKVQAYSVLTHQAVMDGAWKPSMMPLIKLKYPQLSDSQMLEAHAFAYGGAIVQDMGYYPFGSVFFTDLTHYVRTGDFVNNLISEARNANEYAFALGALAHYYSDIHGHSEGTNKSVPFIYPKLRHDHGPVITYGEDHKSHTRTEFAFDVVQAARREYAPEAFRDFIGFKVARDQLARAFKKTYGLELKSVFLSLPLAEWAFRFSVKALIPQFTKMAWFGKRNKIEETDSQAVDSKQLASGLPDNVQKRFGENEDPGYTAKFMAVLMKVVPKVGPLSTLRFKVPTAEAETLFIKSLDQSVLTFETNLLKLRNQEFLPLASYNLDTGAPTSLNEYELADESHQKLLKLQRKDDFEEMSPVLQHYLLTYFAKLPPQKETGKEEKAIRKTRKDLQQLKQKQPAKP